MSSLCSPQIQDRTLTSNDKHLRSSKPHRAPYQPGEIDASSLPDASRCPGVYCFAYAHAGDIVSADPGQMFDSLEEAVTHLQNEGVRVSRDHCACSLGPCRRWTGNESDADYYEPCEPRLERDGLPDLFFYIPRS